MTVLSMFVALLCGGLFVSISDSSRTNKKMFQMLLLIIIILWGIQYCQVKGYYVVGESTLTPAFVRNHGGTVSAYNKGEMDSVEEYGEYMPRFVKRLPPKERAGRISAASGKVTFMNVMLFMERYEFTAIAKEDAEIIVGSFYYPSWKGFVKGEPLSLFTDEEGLIHFRIPKGEHHIVLVFGDTWERKLGKAVSLIGLLIFIPFVLLGLKKGFVRSAKKPLTNENGSNRIETD